MSKDIEKGYPGQHFEEFLKEQEALENASALDFDQLIGLCQRTHQETQRAAVRAVDRSLVVRNWLFGWYIVEYEQRGADRATYGKQLIPKLSKQLKSSHIKGCSATNLWKFREFYHAYPRIPQTASVESGRPEAIPQTLSVESIALGLISTSAANSTTLQTLTVELRNRFSLGWSHYVALLAIENADSRRFYEIEASENDWSIRELKRQIASSLYERLALSRDKEEVRRLAREGQAVEKAADLIKDPVVLEFLGLEEHPSYSESDLETAIIDRLQQFLLELGKGFLFEARQKRFSFDDQHFFVDLVFYNRLLRCYVLIDLKLGKLSHENLGQMQMYVNYFDRRVKADDELPTIGILLCDDKSDAVVELTLPEDSNIYASRYQLYLPSKQELASQIASVRRELEASESGKDD
ncbi:MAG: PDDEXK nuclease domain-containing protein [Gammaproteobacteria bacterium]|nr:PDDEXK nuclease domain-containing protein [Gammaproteobacteria bacterium]